MNKRNFLKAAATLPLLPALFSPGVSLAFGEEGPLALPRARVRPGDPRWPTPVAWDELKQAVGGRLLKLESPFAGAPRR